MAEWTPNVFADDNNFDYAFAEYLNPARYEYQEISNNELPRSELLHEMQNMPPPIPVFQGETSTAADEQIAHLPAPEKKKSRHKKCTEKDVDKTQEASVGERTLKQTLWGVNVFRDWLKEDGRDVNFEEMSKEVLANTLRDFYPSARQQDGMHYQKQSLINIRSAINRHLGLPPYNRTWNLMRDQEFSAANKTFTGNLRLQKQQGLDTAKKTPPIPQDEVKKIYDNYFEPHFDNDPRCLQHKVYFDLSFHLGKRAKENLRKFTKETLALKTNSEGREYLEFTYNESTKKSQGDDYREQKDSAIVLDQPGNRKCPIHSYKLYLSKLNPELPQLFQTPNPWFHLKNANWYKKSPVGENKIGIFMREICEAAGLKTVYKNHSVRGTTMKAMRKAGKSVTDIQFVVKQKNLQSIVSYLDAPDQREKEGFSNDIFEYTGGNADENEEYNSDSSQLDDFEPPGPPKKAKVHVGKGKGVGKSSTKKKITSNNAEVKNGDEKALVAANKEPVRNPLEVIPMDENAAPTATQNNNIMQMLKQNPIGMFMGAQLSGCTININMPK